MKRSIFWMFLCAVFLLIGISSARSQRSNSIEENGSFRMFIGGKEAGFNSYKMVSRKTGFDVDSKSEVTSFVKMRLFEHSRLDRQYHPLAYHLTIILPFGAQEVVAKCDSDSIRIAYRRNLSKPFRKISLERKRPLFLLDNNMIDHWEILLKAIPLKDSVTFHAFALAPTVLKLLEMDITPLGKDTVHVGKKIISSRKIRIKFAGIQATAWVNDSSRELLKLSIPQQSFVTWRTPTPIRFSPAEKDSLLKKFKAQKSPSKSSAYPSKEVGFLSDSIRLAGTLTLPSQKRARKFPAVLFLAGSGALDRDENSEAIHINFFPQLADTLTPNGFVTLRYDKRGTGQSGGNFKTTDVRALLKDARAALRFLKQQPQVDSTRVAVLGHSEGAILGLMLASSGTPMGGLVMMAGTARNMEDVVLDQIAYLLKLQGKSETEIMQKLREEKEFFRKVKEGKLTGFTAQGNSDWWREHLQFNPLKAVCNVKAPLLILNGGKDYQVLAEKDARPLYQKAKSCGVDATLKIYPGLDHLFEPVEGKSTPKKYLKPGRKIPPQVKADIVRWLKEKLSSP